MKLARWLLLPLTLTSLAACALDPPRLTASLGDANSLITVTLEDQTGKIRGIDFVSPIPDWALARDSGEFRTWNDTPNAVWLTWTSGTCLTTVDIRASADGDKTHLDFNPGTRCQSDVGKPRVLAIVFKDPTDAGSVEISAIASPSPSG